ncbi:MAG TPA: hypothetical protein ENH23_07585 [candidate division Zixibacteria bacterium]|nr:hypothetical protein [candidate division Zixibacteria bacterium]
MKSKKTRSKKILRGTKVTVKLTLRELELIRDETFYDPNFAQLAVMDGKGIAIDLSLDEIEDVQGYVAAEANHTKDAKLEKELDRLLNKLQSYLDKYEEQDE